MIGKLFNTNIMQLTEMLDVTDEFIISTSKGEIVSDGEPGYNFETKEETPAVIEHSLLDPNIFRDMKKSGTETAAEFTTGYISFSAPIVNIQYFLGKKPILASKLNISLDDLEKIIYFSLCVVTESKTDLYKIDDIIPLADANKATDIVFLTGAKAIEYLLEKNNVKEKDNIILHCIPVLPFTLRYGKVRIKSGDDDGAFTYRPKSIDRLYKSVLTSSNRLKKLIEIKAPDIIIMNESRMLQEYVDSLVSNGLHGKIYTVYGSPALSFDEIFADITNISEVNNVIPEGMIDYQTLITRLNQLDDYKRNYDDSLANDETYIFENPEYIKLKNKVGESFKNFVKTYTETNYARYTGFTEYICNALCNNFVNAASYLFKEEPENEEDIVKFDIPNVNMQKYYESRLAAHIDLYISKRLKWEIAKCKKNDGGSDKEVQ